MHNKLLSICIVLTAGLVATANAAYVWTDENGIASNHNWTDAGNWQPSEVPGDFDKVMIEHSKYSLAPDAHGPIIDSNVGEVVHVKVGSQPNKQPAVLTVEEGGMLVVKKTGKWPPENGQMVIAQGRNASGTVEMKGGKIIVESMCQVGKRPGRGMIKMSGDAEFIVKGPLKLGGTYHGIGDAFIQLDAGVVKCDGLSLYEGESHVDITGGRLMAGPLRLQMHSRSPKMDGYIKTCVKAGRITAYGGKGKVMTKQDSPEKGWVEVWAVLQDPNAPEETAKPKKAPAKPGKKEKEKQKQQ